MINAEKYLKEYYDSFKYKDKTFTFLKKFGSHLYIDNYYKELSMFNMTGDYIADFNNIVNFYYKKYTNKLKSYNTKDIIKSIYKVNNVQYLNLKKDNFKIYSCVDNVDEFGFKTKKNFISKNKNPLNRKFILYYKCGNRIESNWNNNDKYGCDILNYCFIYKIVEKMINDKLLKNFNQLEIVPTYHGFYPELFKILNFNVNHYTRQDFINNLCLYSNILYPYGMCIEAERCYSTNLVCNLPFLCSKYMSMWYSIIHLPFYFSKGKCINGELKVDGSGDNNEIYSDHGYVGHDYFEFIKKDSKNNTINSLFETFIEKIVELDNYICV